ncbi:hypothetical protein MAC_09255 [Metarhizium acridum CQMa 102]|uniref:MFS transporter n=1 Tax=Metarhizium acridum (strain CQMa 102) TaxID=655827 RepID=E9EHA7_METAQ|nr:uncharacterized protein MAC_09255 [Metarhizium acridum CQMa 102]EFY84703.1 hypothetical protein MAC_09255 [Metarhizium acridum CQMa 102]
MPPPRLASRVAAFICGEISSPWFPGRSRVFGETEQVKYRKWELDADRGGIWGRNLSLIICIPLVGAACGAFAAIPVQNYLGRKRAYIFAHSLLCIPVTPTTRLLFTTKFLIPLLIQAVFPATLALLSLLPTESPVWLLAKGRHHDARRSLFLLREGNAALIEKELALATAAQSHSEHVNVNAWDILKPANPERTISASAPLYLSEIGGQILVLTYSTVILVQSGVADLFKITIIIFLLQFLGTLIGQFLLDKIGRRPVALTGFVVLFAIDIVCGALACVGLATQSQIIGLAALCIIFSFINATCLQSITCAIPQNTNADAVRIIRANLGAKAFLIFGGCMLITLVWSYFYLPETSIRTLAEVDELCAERIPKRHWKVTA